METDLEGHTTLRAPSARSSKEPVAVPCLTILSHPDLARTGDRCILTGLQGKTGVSVSRLEPLFAKPGTVSGEALQDPYISRKPLLITSSGNGGLQLTPREDGTPVHLDGTELRAPTSVNASALKRGVALQISDRIVLWLHLTQQPDRNHYRHGLVGESDAIEVLIQRINQVADLAVPVLLTGPSGAGKELVATALHEGGPRRDKPCVSVNMGAIPSSTANSEVFGHVKGAFTGAHRDHAGYFSQADSGTLFMDEIGECTPELQVMLLRALETGEILPIGSQKPEAVDVRLITATDRDLQAMCAEGHFREPLLHRIATYQILVPSLSERIEDLGRLFQHFLKQELAILGNSEVADASADTPFIPAALMSQMALYHWPGNVRQLRNVVRQLCISSRGKQTLQVDDSLQQLFAERATETPTPEKETGYRKPEQVSEDEVIEALKLNAYRINPTAKALGLSRTSLYSLIDKSSRIRKAGDLTKAQVEVAIESCDGNLDKMASELEVSKRGLVLRMNELGLS